VSLSPDDGQTWTALRISADGVGELMYPSAAQAPDGRIHIVYSQDRAWIQHVVVTEAWSPGTRPKATEPQSTRRAHTPRSAAYVRVIRI